MIELRPDEEALFNFGEQIEVPAEIRGDGFCFHKTLWFATGRIAEIPIWSRWNNERQWLEQVRETGVCTWKTAFETADLQQVLHLDHLRSMETGLYFVQLLDIDNMVG